MNGFESATSGQVFGVAGSTNSSTNYAAGVTGFEGANAGEVFGVTGSTNSATSGSSGLNGFEGAKTGGPVYGVSGYAASTQGVGVFGSAQATSGFAVGVEGATSSAEGVGGLFQNLSTDTGAKILVAEDSTGTERLTVDVQGNVTVATGTTTQVKGPLAPLNHARGVVTILQNQNYFVTLNWSFPFPDTNYTVTCTPVVSSGYTGGGVYLLQVTSTSSTSVQVEVAAYPSGDVFVHCIGVHD